MQISLVFDRVANCQQTLDTAKLSTNNNPRLMLNCFCFKMPKIYHTQGAVMTLLRNTPILLALLLCGCVSTPPADIHHACHIFKQYPHWYKEAKDVEHRWGVPIPVQMAIIYQESKFDAQAQPKRTKLLWFIPWSRPSTAYGYAQALRTTWSEYRRDNGGFFSSRDNFGDGVDFIGWYANQAHQRAHISRSDAYALYLAYHEGVGGYLRRTYLSKKWLVAVAHKVASRAKIYHAQLQQCKKIG